MVQYQQDKQKRDPRTPIEMEERATLPVVWLVIMGLVVLGFIANLTVNLFSSGGLSVWPVVVAISILLVINDASEKNAVGVPPLQAYGLFFGVLFGLFGFLFLISRTINPWVLVILTVGVGGYLAYDWTRRKRVQRETDRRRVAGLCVRCQTPVTSDLDAHCPNCDLPVHGERLNLLRLGKAIANRSLSARTRGVLSGQTQVNKGTGHKKMQNLQQQRAYKYKKAK